MRAIGGVLLTAAVLVGLAPGIADAVPNEDGIYPMIFPVQGPNNYKDTFGAPRSGGRTHEGQDIMTYGVKGVPVVAAEEGYVTWIGSTCCGMAIKHPDGWSTWYIHLNNDTQNPDGTFSDDGAGWGIAPGITRGTWVEAGQLIGWVGDSGNAEWTAPHLHFELRDPTGKAVNPYESLLAATPVPPSDPLCTGGVDCDTVAFQDSGGRFRIWDEATSGVVDSSFYYGNPGDIAFSGDWDCDGVETLGLYRQSDGYVYLRNSNTQGVAEITFFFGNPGDLPISGDFNGSGCDTVSIYRPSEGRFYIINELGSDDRGLGASESDFLFGDIGDKPFVGDFNNDGIDTIGLHRESNGLVYFRDTNTEGVADFSFIYGDPGDKLIAGDWDGDGDETVGVYRPSNRMLYLRNANTQGIADGWAYAGSYSGIVSIDP